MSSFSETNMYIDVEQWNSAPFKPYRLSIDPWSHLDIFGRDTSSRTSAVLKDVDHAVDTILVSADEYNGFPYFGGDWGVAGEQQPSVMDGFLALNDDGSYSVSHNSQGSEHENTVMPQKYIVPSATQLPIALEIRSEGDMVDSVSEGTYNTDETQSQNGLLGQYHIPDQSVNPANLQRYTPDHEQPGSIPWFGCQSCEPSLCSSLDTASTSSLPSTEEEGSVDSDSNTKCISPSEMPNSTYKAKRKQIYRSEKDTFHHNRKTGRTAGAKVTKSRKKTTYRTCGECKKDFSEAEYKKHQQSQHRNFICSFSFAGCTQCFASKNEWKRHVITQHMYLTYWKCELCEHEQPIFNRKDLIGQHLKRMHGPFAKRVPTTTADKAAHDTWIKEDVPRAQDMFRHTLRDPPTECSCEICGPAVVFKGAGAWDAKIAHVGKHYEDNNAPANSIPFEDLGLIKWARKHGIVEPRKPMEDGLMDSMAENQKFSALPSKATHNTFVENWCKYQFTKVSPSSHDPYENEYAETFLIDDDGDYFILDGANEAGPNDNDTTLLLYSS